MKQAEFPMVLQKIFESLSRLNEDEISRLADDSYSIEFKVVRKRVKDSLETVDSALDAKSIVDNLSKMANRDEAHLLISQNFNSRRQLELIARELNIPILKQDKIDVLRDKIIEFTVGARIRSETIQGKNG